MKLHISQSLLILVGFLASCGSQKAINHDSLTPWQIRENERFSNPDTSPLTPEDRATFEGLDFFAYDQAFKVVAQLERTPDAPIFEMSTTTSRRPKHRQFGIIRFKLQDQSLQLNVYQSKDHSDNPIFRKLLFLPFYDATAGESTYGGGRYISLTIPEGDDIIVDFNEAYNPYCVYKDGFSCPITPRENNLQTVAIKAGTKDFKQEEH